MADRMRNDDLDMDMGGAGQQKDDFGKQTPGRNKQDDFSTGQRGAGQHGQQREPGHMKDDEEFDNFGNSEKPGGKSGGKSDQNW